MQISGNCIITGKLIQVNENRENLTAKSRLLRENNGIWRNIMYNNIWRNNGNGENNVSRKKLQQQTWLWAKYGKLKETKNLKIYR